MSYRIKWRPTRRVRSGFTLIELLVVIAVIATLAAIVGPAVLHNIGDAKISAARSQIEILVLALESYRMHNDAYPTTHQGLEALRTLPTVGDVPPGWRGPYIRKPVPLDPWRRQYIYVSPGRENADGYDLYSFGKDGKHGGEGEDADLTSWGGTVVQ